MIPHDVVIPRYEQRGDSCGRYEQRPPRLLLLYKFSDIAEEIRSVHISLQIRGDALGQARTSSVPEANVTETTADR